MKARAQGHESLDTWQASGFMLHVIGKIQNCGDRGLVNPESNLTSHGVGQYNLIAKYGGLVFCMALYIFPSFCIIQVLLNSIKALARD